MALKLKTLEKPVCFLNEAVSFIDKAHLITCLNTFPAVKLGGDGFSCFSRTHAKIKGTNFSQPGLTLFFSQKLLILVEDGLQGEHG